MQDYIPYTYKRQNLRHQFMPISQKPNTLQISSLVNQDASDQDISSRHQKYTLMPIPQTTPVQRKINVLVASPLKKQQQQQQLFVYSELPSQDYQTIVSAYVDMINQEDDIFYLFDSFHQLLSSLKQVQEHYGIKIEANPFKTNVSSSKSDWLTLSSMGSQWTGMKNIKPVQDLANKSRFEQQPFANSNLSKIHPMRDSSSVDGYNSSQVNASRIIDKLKREIGEMTEDQKHKQSVRNVCGLTGVQVPQFTTEKLHQALFSDGRKKLISVYQLQNKIYKSHLGFCQLSVNAGVVPEDGSAMTTDVIIHKMFFAKYHRKTQGFFNLIFQLLQHIFLEYKASLIKIKVNSSQSTFLKLYQDLGFKLRSKQSILGELVIISLALQKSNFNLTYRAATKKSYL